MNQSDESIRMLEEFLTIMNDNKIHSPVVIDADGINNLSNLGNWETNIKTKILTPHIGEMSKISKIHKKNTNRQKKYAVEYAKKWNTNIVLKGQKLSLQDQTN